MTRGRLWKISVATTVEAADAVAESLTNIFAQSAATHTDFEIGRTTVSVFCGQRPALLPAKRALLRAGLAHIKSCGLNIGTGRVSIRLLRRENWAESWKRHFKPIEITNSLLIKPSWSARKARPGQAVVMLDPGLSFGTGQHPTTEFCLRELVRAREGRRSEELPHSFLDIGTGSGILAIAAAKLGYAPVHAFDFDPQSVRAARANARANRVQHKLRITRADVTRLPRRAAPRYNFVCANLLANLLISERDRIIARLKPTGTLVVAGILKREFDKVAAAYRAVGMKLVGCQVREEWRSGTFAFSRVE